MKSMDADLTQSLTQIIYTKTIELSQQYLQ
jgi:hypothetical protein